MENIDFFVFMNTFVSKNNPVSAEIGFAQILKSSSGLGCREYFLWTVDLSSLEFTERDKEINSVQMYREVHGIIPPHSVSWKRPKFHHIKYKDLNTLMDYYFEDGSKKKYFAVKGREQLLFFNNMFNRGKYIFLDVEEEFGILLDNAMLKYTNGSSSMGVTPMFHEGFHSENLEDRCAGKIAFKYADFIQYKLDTRSQEHIPSLFEWGEDVSVAAGNKREDTHDGEKKRQKGYVVFNDCE